jgi:CheY-like chemotaxis protein
LAIIVGYANVLKKENKDPQKVLLRSDAILKASERGSDLVRQLLTFARKSEVIFQPVDINKISAEVSSMLTETLPKNISMKLNLDSELPNIWGFSSHIHQALLNLCLNARDAMPEGGSIEIFTGKTFPDQLPISTSENKASLYVYVRIQDNGIGMDEETKTRIYDPFFTTKERGRGTGLGLAVVYGIVQSHKGIIDLKTVRGSGSVFTIYFPVPDELLYAKSEEISEIGKKYEGNETILLVEDEAMLSTMLKETLTENGYEIFSASNGEEAVETFRNNNLKIKLVVADLDLPKKNGWAAFQEMKKVNQNIKGLFITGFIEEARETEIANSGNFLVHKPYSPDFVLKKIREILDGMENTL